MECVLTMSHEKMIFVNGRWVEAEQALVSVEDRGFQLGDGIYEVLRVYGGRPFALRRHLERLVRSAEQIELELPVDSDRLAEIIREAVARQNLPEAQVYVQVTRGYAPRVHHFPERTTASLIVYASPARVPSPEVSRDGGEAIVVPDERWLRCDIKTINLLPNALAKERARRAGVLEALLEREGIGITEGSSSNLFVVRGGRLQTAPAGRYILRGITRDIVLELATANGLNPLEEFFQKDDLLKADEAFITSTNMEVMPLTTVDGHRIGDGRPGPVTRQLADAFREKVAAVASKAT